MKKVTSNFDNATDEVLDLAHFSSSTLVHTFGVKPISGLYESEINELLSSAYVANGDFSVCSYNNTIYSITYETTDEWEFREDFAIQLAKTVNEILNEFANSKGGYEVIKG